MLHNSFLSEIAQDNPEQTEKKKIFLQEIKSVLEKLKCDSSNRGQEIKNLFKRMVYLQVMWMDIDAQSQELLVNLIRDHIKYFDYSETSIVLRACARLELPLKELQLTESFMNAVRRNVKEFQSDDIVNVLVAFARLNVTWKDLERENLANPLLDAIDRNHGELITNVKKLFMLQRTQMWFKFGLPTALVVLFNNALKYKSVVSIDMKYLYIPPKSIEDNCFRFKTNAVLGDGKFDRNLVGSFFQNQNKNDTMPPSRVHRHTLSS